MRISDWSSDVCSSDLRFLGIAAAIGGVMDARRLDRAHCAGSTSSTPRRIWSRSMLSNSALKLPSPKPSSPLRWRSEEHTSELQSLMRSSYAVFCLTQKHTTYTPHTLQRTQKQT